MGLFDSVYVDCPHCGSPVEIQSKADECPYMNRYTPETAPLHILHDVMNEPVHCLKCDGWLTLTDPRAPLAPVDRPPTVALKVKPPPSPTTHPQGFKWWPDDEPFGLDNLM